MLRVDEQKAKNWGKWVSRVQGSAYFDATLFLHILHRFLPFSLLFEAIISLKIR
jgi:hypothetical protein